MIEIKNGDKAKKVEVVRTHLKERPSGHNQAVTTLEKESRKAHGHLEERIGEGEERNGEGLELTSYSSRG